MNGSPPRLAERLLRWCLRSTASARFILGDLRQEVATVRRERGRWIAWLWYWREAAAIAVRYLGRSPEPLENGLASPRVATSKPSVGLDLARDLRGSFRVFVQAPGFAVAVVLTLALGLGVNATMFNAVDRVLLSAPEHVRDHEQLRFLYLAGMGSRSLNSPMAYSFPDYEAIRGVPALEDASAFRPRRRVTMGSGAEARRVIVQDATAEFFPVLGVQPAQGRLFDAQDDQPGAAPVAVVSHPFWQREFGGDPSVIGRVVTLASHPFEIIGVAPPGFTGANLESVDAWVPLRMNVALTARASVLESRGAWWFRVIVRLQEGVTDDEAEVQMTAAHLAGIAAAQESGSTEGDERTMGGAVRTGSLIAALGPNADADTSITLWLAGVSLLVLLITCANVTNLLLARGLGRQRDRAVRLAFGVSRRRLISQALAETLALALVGGLAAVLVANWSGRALYGILLSGVPQPDTAVSLRLVGFLGLVVLLATLLAGLLPALQAVRTAPGDVLRRAGRGSTGQRGRARTLLTLGQVSLSTVLLFGAGLFVQSLHNALQVDVGFDEQRLVNVQFDLDPNLDAARRDALHREALALVTSMPGVEHAVLSSSQRPLYGWDEQSRMKVSRLGALPPVPQGGPYTYSGTEGYVETAGLQVIQGRAFDAAEYQSGGPFALMVSRSFAEGVWPGLDPLQECITLDHGPNELDGPEPCRPVVGVYEDLIVRSIADRDHWSVTWPLSIDGQGLRGILLRAEEDAAALVGPIRERLAALSDEFSYLHVVPMAARLESMRGPWRVGATLFSVFGLLALVVASLGLYSVLTFAVAQRRREIGIRAALGARRGDLVVMVLLRAGRLVGAGLAVGMVVALFAARFMESVLFDVPTINPFVCAVVSAVLIAAGLLAAWLPARRATAIDPAGAMTVD